jgi:hypothetical protein
VIACCGVGIRTQPRITVCDVVTCFVHCVVWWEQLSQRNGPHAQMALARWVHVIDTIRYKKPLLKDTDINAVFCFVSIMTVVRIYIDWRHLSCAYHVRQSEYIHALYPYSPWVYTFLKLHVLVWCIEVETSLPIHEVWNVGITFTWHVGQGYVFPHVDLLHEGNDVFLPHSTSSYACSFMTGVE